jgi:hypothetical protein
MDESATPAGVASHRGSPFSLIYPASHKLVMRFGSAPSPRPLRRLQGLLGWELTELTRFACERVGDVNSGAAAMPASAGGAPSVAGSASSGPQR